MTFHTDNAAWWRRLVAVLLLGALVAAGCGGDDDDEGADDADTEEEAAADPNGIVRIAYPVTANSPATQFDPSKLTTPALPMHFAIYGQLLVALPDGTYKPDLATEAEVVDPTSIKVTLRPNLKFSDGTALDAAAAKAGIERNAAATNPGALSADLKQIESVTVGSPTEFTIKLKTPIAGAFYPLLSRGETLIVSPKAVADGVDLMKTPVGAGPFLLEGFTVERSVTLKKSPTYWGADDIGVAGVEYVHTASGESVINALQTDAADAADNVQPDVVPELEGTGVEVREVVTESTLLWGQTCKSRPPLDNLKVRQAINYAIDRDEINTIVYGGKSEPMWGFWSTKSKFHDKELTGFYKRDVAKAKKLLEEAGVAPGLVVEAVVPNTGGVGLKATELIQGQLKDVGIEMKIVQSANVVQDFFIENKYPVQFFPLQRSGLDRVTRNLQPGSIGNICGYNNPQLNDLVSQLKAVQADSPEAVALWKKLDRLALEEAMNIFGVFGTTANAWNPDKLGGVSFIANFQGLPHLDLKKVFVKQ